MSCAGSGERWVKIKRKTSCPICNKTIAQIGGHPDNAIPKH